MTNEIPNINEGTQNEANEPKQEANLNATPEAKEIEIPENLEESYKELYKSREMAEKRLKDKDRYITEISTKRAKQARELNEIEQEVARLKGELPKDQSAMERGDWEKVSKFEMAQEKLNKAKTEYSTLNNEDIILSKHPDFTSLIDDIAEEALNDGYSADQIKAFKENPYAADPYVANNLADKVKLRRELKARTRSDDVLDNVEKSAQNRTINNSSGTPNLKIKSDYSPRELESMTYEQVLALKNSLQPKQK